MTARVVSVGNAMVDVVAAVPHLPDRGADVLAERGRLDVGGGGFRALVAVREAGVAAAFAGRSGAGAFGDLVRGALAELGIADLLPPVDGADTGFVLVQLEPDGERTFTTVRGAESADPLLAAVPVGPDDLLHLHGYGLVDRDRAIAIADWLGEQEAPALLDPGPFGADADPAALARLLPRLDWWSGNGREAVAATGLGDPSASARLLAGAVRRGAIVRLGGEGCVLAERGGAVMHLAAPVVRAVDTIGAGDHHVGTFLAALALGAAPVDAAVSANEAAARFVTRGDRRWSGAST